MATASLVLSIIALILTIFPVVSAIAIPLSLIGVILGVVGKKQLYARGEPTGTGTAGIVMSTIALVFSIIFTVACGLCVTAIGAASPSLMDIFR